MGGHPYWYFTQGSLAPSWLIGGALKYEHAEDAIGKTFANLSAGLDLAVPASSVDVRFVCDGRFGVNTEAHTGRLRLGWRF